jgi:uncharacterized membrane protein
MLRMDFLISSIQQGDLAPSIYPDWYMGMQLFRYYPMLSYYLLIFIKQVCGQSLAAVNWFIVLSAWLGGVSCLLYRRWVGWITAISAGLVYLVLPDNVRVAFSEGNLPRVLASAFVPLLFFFILDHLENSKHKGDLAGIAVLFMLFVRPPDGRDLRGIAMACVALLWLVKSGSWRAAPITISMARY